MWFAEIFIAAMLGGWVLLILMMLTVLTIADVVLLAPWALVRQSLARPRSGRAHQIKLN